MVCGRVREGGVFLSRVRESGASLVWGGGGVRGRRVSKPNSSRGQSHAELKWNLALFL